MTEPLPAGRTLLARGRRGAVVAPHHLATEAGLRMLRAGGHAVDAAIAANAALGVVMPNACGLGGDAFWLIWDAGGTPAGPGRQLALNGSGRSPSGTDAARLRREGLEVMPTRGPRSVTVPGAVRSWGDAHRRFGRLPVATLLAPAIELAAGGFPAWPELIDAIEGTAGHVRDALGSDAGFFEVYRPRGRAWRPGELVRLPALAGTLEALAADGFDAFYEGRIGERQARLLADLGAACGPADFRDHTSTWAEPIETSYRGVRLTTHPPNSSGVVALELLNILEQLEVPVGAFGAAGLHDATWAHLAIEAAKLAMADRDAHLTDPAAAAVPVERLLDKDHAMALAALIDPQRASVPRAATNPPGGGTAYLAAVDGDGNAVSLIQSNYLGFGSGVVDPETGVHYQNRGSYFSLHPDHPNVLAPGKRTLHTLMPCMLFRDGRVGPWIVVGSMGGDAQPQIHAQFVSDVVDGGLDLAQAVAAPRWSVEPRFHFDPPRTVAIESGFDEDFTDALAQRGHPLVSVGGFEGGIGHQHAIELVSGGPAAPGGSVAAVTDPRSAGLPAVW
jgi:gamma-glutamyltranspeptidase / glutathione hydrolase